MTGRCEPPCTATAHWLCAVCLLLQACGLSAPIVIWRKVQSINGLRRRDARMSVGRMQSNRLAAKVEEFSLPQSTAMGASVAIPAVKGTWQLKYGKHAYYFMNFRTSKGFCASVSHRDVIRPGLGRFKKANEIQGRSLSTLRCFSRRYHYGFNCLELPVRAQQYLQAPEEGYVRGAVPRPRFRVQVSTHLRRPP